MNTEPITDIRAVSEDERMDEQFLAHSLATRRKDDVPEIGYLPVTITRWPPGERVYGRPTEEKS